MADFYPIETRWRTDPKTGQRKRRMKNGHWTTRPRAVDRQPGIPRGYSWPPFIEGMSRAMAVGAKYVVQPMAAGIIAWLFGEAEKDGSPIGYLLEPQFAPAVERWANAEARRMRLEAYVAENGEFDGFGRPRASMGVLEAWEKRSQYMAERLGLDPMSLVKIRQGLADLHREKEAETTLQDLQTRYARRLSSAQEEGGEVE